MEKHTEQETENTPTVTDMESSAAIPQEKMRKGGISSKNDWRTPKTRRTAHFESNDRFQLRRMQVTNPAHLFNCSFNLANHRQDKEGTAYCYFFWTEILICIEISSIKGRFRSNIQINASRINDHLAITQILDESSHKYHTFKLTTKKTLRAGFRGILHIFNLTKLKHMLIKVEPQKGRTSAPQRHRCQKYGTQSG